MKSGMKSTNQRFSLTSPSSVSIAAVRREDESKTKKENETPLVLLYDVKHETNLSGIYAYEKKEEGAYLWEKEVAPHAFPVTKRRLGSALQAARASKGPQPIRHGWSKEEISNTKNISIFPFLIGNTKLCCFVQEWYQSSCGIIYRPPHGDGKIIGTGCLVEPTKVVTARHNFQNIPQDQLFIRFYNYQVNRTDEDQFLSVKVRYLDIPVIRRFPLENGSDAGYLEIPVLADQSIFRQYAKVLLPNMNFGNSSRLHPGIYAYYYEGEQRIL